MEKKSSGCSFQRETADKIHFICGLNLTPRIHTGTGEVDSEVCSVHLCLPWLPTQKKSPPIWKREAGDESGACSLQWRKGGGEKKPEPDSPSLERKIWKSLGFKVHKSAKNSGEATRCRPYGEGKTALSVKPKKKGSVWAGIIERHSKQSAGHSGDTTAQRDPGGVPAFNTLGKNAPEDLEPLKRADKRSRNYGRSSGRVRSSENPATGQGPPLLSAPDHPYSHVARWCELCPTGNESIKPEMSILLNKRDKIKDTKRGVMV